MNGGGDKPEDVGDFASSPCMMHRFDELETAKPPARLSTWGDITAWRRAERKRQIDRRIALDVRIRSDRGARIAEHLETAIGDIVGITVSFYWPIRGEPDLRDLSDRIVQSGGRCALPVVSARNRPLTFRAWQRGDALEPGFWNIPVPADGAEVVPDVVLAPVVAFDRNGYRLGYGGGYFDRTLAAMRAQAAMRARSETIGQHRVLGVGYAMAAIDTIYPQPHDIPMDAIVTESGVAQRVATGQPEQF